jgi:hypothetical protein
MRRPLLIAVALAAMPVGSALAQCLPPHPYHGVHIPPGVTNIVCPPYPHRAPPAPPGPTIYHYPDSQSNDGYQIQWPGSSDFDPELYLR